MRSARLSQPPAAAEGPQALRSVLLPALLADLPRQRRVSILDLGPARQANIDCFSAFSLRYTCWDIGEGLAELRRLVLPPAGTRLSRAARAAREARRAEMEAARRQLIDDMLDAIPTRDWDLVLAWEIFNYLDRPVLSLFLQGLVDGMRRGGRIHALIWGQGRMPARMADVCFAPGPALLRDAPTEEEFVEGGYSQYQLRGLCEGLVVHKGVLLRNGLQELNLSYGGRPL